MVLCNVLGLLRNVLGCIANVLSPLHNKTVLCNILPIVIQFSCGQILIENALHSLRKLAYGKNEVFFATGKLIFLSKDLKSTQNSRVFSCVTHQN